MPNGVHSPVGNITLGLPGRSLPVVSVSIARYAAPVLVITQASPPLSTDTR